MPPGDIDQAQLEAAAGASACEWKGEARYWTVVANGQRLTRVAWSYPHPFAEFAALADFVAFYPGRLECLVEGVRVRPQPGGFYGGWITPEIVGPFKGEPGEGRRGGRRRLTLTVIRQPGPGTRERGLGAGSRRLCYPRVEPVASSRRRSGPGHPDRGPVDC